MSDHHPVREHFKSWWGLWLLAVFFVGLMLVAQGSPQTQTEHHYVEGEPWEVVVEVCQRYDWFGPMYCEWR